jgi:DNA repair exonuclease SbcCD ATPase subunit
MDGELLSNPFLRQRRELSGPNSVIQSFNEAVSALLTDARRRTGKLGPELAGLQEYLDAQPKDELARLRKEELVRTLERARDLVTEITSADEASEQGLESRLKDLEELVANISDELASVRRQLEVIRQGLP